jgi:hypothetical protein
MMMNAYDVLQVTPDTPLAAVAKAYRLRALETHPDKHPNDPEAGHRFAALVEAYESLLDPNRQPAIEQQWRARLKIHQMNQHRRDMVQELVNREQQHASSSKSVRVREEIERFRAELMLAAVIKTQDMDAIDKITARYGHVIQWAARYQQVVFIGLDNASVAANAVKHVAAVHAQIEDWNIVQALKHVPPVAIETWSDLEQRVLGKLFSK